MTPATPAFRLCRNTYLKTAFSGEGAKLAGGRWNSPGLAAVYCASSLSLATLEVLVHLEEPEILCSHFSYIEIEIPGKLVLKIDGQSLPASWRDDTTFSKTIPLGNSWLRTRQSAALSVPSAVTPGEINYLLNPSHPDFRKIKIGNVRRFEPDPRLA